jgi:diguanylate cyclase (GGDEF)-like protein
VADSYSYYPGSTLKPGQWFDLVWSILLVIPLVIAATWNEEEPTDTEAAKKAHSIVIREFFPVLFPFLSLLLLAHVALNHTLLAALLLVVCFVSSSARTLIIQHRHQRSEAAVQRAKDVAENANHALVRAQQALQIEATHDALTKLWNRGAIFDLLEKEVQRQSRIQGSLLVVILADVDHLKKINDSHGHPVGDVVLQEVAKRLTRAVRTYDSVGRYGGEEFLIILPGCTASDLLAGAERLRYSLADRPIATSAGPIAVTISIGVVSAPMTEGDPDTDALLKAADRALYLAKAKGRNRVESLDLPLEGSATVTTQTVAP